MLHSARGVTISYTLLQLQCPYYRQLYHLLVREPDLKLGGLTFKPYSRTTWICFRVALSGTAGGPPLFGEKKKILFYLTLSIAYRNFHCILISILRFSLTNQNGRLDFNRSLQAAGFRKKTRSKISASSACFVGQM